jgi:putative ABC transport system permease protein
MRNGHLPPKLFLRFFRWYCHPKHRDFIEGDLLEDYNTNINRHSKRRADIIFMVDVLLLIRKEVIRPLEGYTSLNTYGMYKNYFKIYWRTINRNKIHSFINTSGLAVGLAAVMLTFLYIHDELNFNSMHPHPDRTFRLANSYVGNNGQPGIDNTAFGNWGRRMKEELPEVEHLTQALHLTFPANVRHKASDKSVLTDDRKWVDRNFPEIFTLDIVKGNREKFFELPHSMAISESAAKDMFGDEDPIGQVLTVNERAATGDQDAEMVVTAVYRDFPMNSTFRNKYLFNVEALRTFKADYEQIRERAGFETYVMLKENASREKVDEFLNDLAKIKQKEFSQWLSSVSPVMVSLIDLHFDQQATWDYTGTTGNKKYLLILSVIALLILFIACINYMNLTTAKTATRAREVGIRKSFGSSRKRIAAQFMIESAVMAAVAFIVSFALAAAFLPLFNLLSLKRFTVNNLMEPNLLLVFVGIAFFTAVAGGIYPAFVMSGFRPIAVLKSRVGESGAGQFFRKTLVTVQYVVSISLTIITIVIVRQVDLMHDSKLNEHGDQLMMLRFGSTMEYNDFFTLRNELLKEPGIENVAVGDAFPRLDHWGIADLTVTLPGVTDKPMQWNQLLVDYNFSSMFNIPVVSGRNFELGNTADTLSILINQAALKSIALPVDKILGTSVTLRLGENRDGSAINVERKIIGIVADFPYQNMKRDIEPLILNPNPNLRGFAGGTMVYVKLSKGQVPEKIEVVQSTWKKLFPETGLQYYFVNDLFGRLYKSELTMSKLALNFSGLAILITMFGLFGLASYAAERRTKEIGVRKVHGASVWQITTMMMAGFLRIFGVAAVIVVPTNYFVLREWLSMFRYQTSLDVFVFIIGLGLILMITLLTVSYETIKAAVANPVKTLRYE